MGKEIKWTFLFFWAAACGLPSAHSEVQNQATRSGAATGVRYVPSGYFDNRRESQEYIRTLNRFLSDPDLRKSQEAVSKALAFYFKARDGGLSDCGGDSRAPDTIANQEWVVVVDYTRPNLEFRKFYLNVRTGQIVKDYAAHGSGSGDGTPIPTVFSDRENSNATNGGFFLTRDVYTSVNRRTKRPKKTFGGQPNNALRLIGLERRNRKSLTGQSEARGIVMHGATYVFPGNVGNSQGCPAGQLEVFNQMKYQVDQGALVYLHTIDVKGKERPACPI